MLQNRTGPQKLLHLPEDCLYSLQVRLILFSHILLRLCFIKDKFNREILFTSTDIRFSKVQLPVQLPSSSLSATVLTSLYWKLMTYCMGNSPSEKLGAAHLFLTQNVWGDYILLSEQIVHLVEKPSNIIIYSLQHLPYDAMWFSVFPTVIKTFSNSKKHAKSKKKCKQPISLYNYI